MVASCPPLSVAPMMDRTDRHFRYLIRQVTRSTLLYTEMITVDALLRRDPSKALEHDPAEHPVALQLGGDDPARLAEGARLAEAWGFDEVNLNCGCPSPRVQTGRFGAVLMADPNRVAEAVSAMKAAVRVPVTVKHRIGIDDLDRYEDMLRFVDVVASSGADRFTVHARKAWLHGLSPKENRTVPPLRPEAVYRLKRERPELAIELNGGVQNLDAVQTHLARVDAVMIGRATYDDPLMLAEADARFFGHPPGPPARPENVVSAMIPYVERVARQGERPHAVMRHMLGLFSGERGARAFRRVLSREGPGSVDGRSVLEGALKALAEARERPRRPASNGGAGAGPAVSLTAG